MIGFLAQAFDEAVPDGTTGMAAAEAIAAFLDKAGYTIVPKDPAPANVDDGKVRMDKHILLHIYGQISWHCPALIVGNRRALSAIRDAISTALESGKAECYASARGVGWLSETYFLRPLWERRLRGGSSGTSS